MVFRDSHRTQSLLVQTRLRAIKIRNTPSFGGEVKALAPCRYILQHITEVYENETTFLEKIQHFLLLSPPDLLLDASAGKITKECSGGRIRVFPVDIIPPLSPGSYITGG
jgi:hypothetical protein